MNCRRGGWRSTSLIRSSTGVLTLFGLLLMQAGGLPLSSSPSSAPTAPQARLLSGGQRLERGLVSGEQHAYRISLSPNEFLFVEVDQRGIDAVVALLDPAGATVIQMDSPEGRRGRKPICAVAKVSGPYRLKLSGKGTGWRGSYRLTVREVRKATKADYACDTALRIITEGDNLREKQPVAAIEKYRTALSAWSAVSDAWGQVLALERLGSLLTNQSSQDALSAYGKALPLARALGDRRVEAHLSSRAAVVHINLGEQIRALPLAQNALAIAEAEGYLDIQASTRNILGIALRGLGRIQDALVSYRIAQELWQQAKEPAEEARVLSNRGELYMSLGMTDQALASFNQALPLLSLEEKRDVRFWVLAGAAAALHEKLELPRAKSIYSSALDLARTPREQMVILARMSIVRRDEGDLPEAISLLEKSLQLARLQGDGRREAYALADLAHMADMQKRAPEAVQKFDQVLEILTELRDPAAMASALFGRAEAERNRGRFDAAIASVEESISLVESLRSNLSPGPRIAFFASRHKCYELYVNLLMDKHRQNPDAGYQARAFEIAERSRARSLLDDMAGRPSAAAMTLREIQREVLDRDSLLLSYQLGDPKSTLWLVTPDFLTSFDLPRRSDIEKEVLRVRERLSNGAVLAEAGALSGMLIPAGIAPLGRKRLLIVPDGILHLAPFAALCESGLPDGGCRTAPLVLDHEIVQLPSASVLGRMRKKLASRQPAAGSIGVLADPVFERRDRRLVEKIGEPRPEEKEPESGLGIERLGRLRYTDKEADEILKLFPAEAGFSVRGFSASRETAMSPEFLRNRILHFATHNLVAEHPDLSGLVLSRFDASGRRMQGFLGVQEIYGLKLSAELVVLSACGTGLGSEVRGEGVVGLTRAFLHSGAKRVVVSLWNVQERETTELMTRFYRKLHDGLPASAALRSAQASMFSDGYRPRAWASFVLQGEPR
jgi:CHAT domain-containing protein/tetratricopeptide (TPR) repeat protein